MAPSEDLTGRTFDRLTVLCRADDALIEKYGKNKKHKPYWLCQCECGNLHLTTAHSLLFGTCRSCGCLAKDVAKEQATHKSSDSKLYSVYCAMKDRCYNPNNPYYPDYGGRGIYVCKEWYDPNLSPIELKRAGNPGFVAFKEWAYANGYFDFDDSLPWKDKPTLDRKDVNGPYCPENCRWVTQKVQNNNRRNTRCITDFDGSLLSFADADVKYNLRHRQIVTWDNGNWSNDEMLYGIAHPELKLRRKVSTGMLVDEEGLTHLIPRYTDTPDREVKVSDEPRVYAKYLTDFDGSQISYADFERKYNLYKGCVNNLFKSNWSNDDILYKVAHPDLNLHRKPKIGMLVDDDGFIQMVPRYTNVPDPE